MGCELWKLFNCAATMLVTVQRPPKEWGASLADICQTDGQQKQVGPDHRRYWVRER